MLFAPLEGWREVKVTERRTAIDYAQVLKELSDIHFADADKIVLVQDNLNTHTPAALYEAFTASQARRLAERFEWHYTPKHGSWLNMAESELATLPANVSTGASPTSGPLSARSRPGSSVAIPITAKQTGGLQPPTPASS
jgi:DDE superfamily endonuclease